MLVVAQNRFKTSGSASKGRMGKRQDSFHYEPPTEQGLLVPEQHQLRRHSTGNVAGTINIAELQQNLASSKTASKVLHIYYIYTVKSLIETAVTINFLPIEIA